MGKKLTDAKREAIARYDAKATRQIHLKLNVKTDADILEHLDSVENVQGYIKDLIRMDMKNRSVVYCKDCWRRDSFDCCLHEGGYPYHDTADDWFCGDGEKDEPK